MKYFRLTWILFNLFISTTIIGIFIIVFGWIDTKKQVIGILPRLWGKWFLVVSGITYSIRGLEYLKKNQQYIFIGNHESHLDIPLSVASIPYNLVFLAKKELFNIPIFGWVMKSAGMVRVNRQDRLKAKRSVDYALTQLKNTCVSVMLFPEGTRSRESELLPFKKGGFILAIRSKLPIVPITIIESGNALPKGSLFINKKHIQIIIEEPINTELYSEKDKDVLLNRCQQSIQNNKVTFQAK